MNCWVCNTELIWGGDHDIEDEGYDGHTIIQISLVHNVTHM